MGVGIVQHAHNSKLVRGQYVAPPAWRSPQPSPAGAPSAIGDLLCELRGLCVLPARSQRDSAPMRAMP